MGTLYNIWRMIPILSDTLFTIVVMWSFQVNVSFIITPIIFVIDTLEMISSSILINKLSVITLLIYNTVPITT